MKWSNKLKYDPVPSLLSFNNEALSSFVRRDLLDEDLSVENLWELSEPQKILRKQQIDGSWKYPGIKNDARIQGY